MQLMSCLLCVLPASAKPPWPVQRHGRDSLFQKLHRESVQLQWPNPSCLMRYLQLQYRTPPPRMMLPDGTPPPGMIPHLGQQEKIAHHTTRTRHPTHPKRTPPTHTTQTTRTRHPPTHTKHTPPTHTTHPTHPPSHPPHTTIVIIRYDERWSQTKDSSMSSLWNLPKTDEAYGYRNAVT